MNIAELKRESSEVELDGISVNYDKSGFAIIQKSTTEIVVPCRLNQLNIISHIKEYIADIENGSFQVSAWENPEVPSPKNIYSSEYLCLSYLTILSYLNLKDTRDLWKKFTRHKSTFISYIKNSLFSSKLINQYKIAFLTCYIKKYDLEDLDKIKKVFMRNGLSSDNYIFYILFLFEERYGCFEFDSTDPAILTMEDLDEESQDLVSRNMPLFMWHTRKSLLFIIQSHKMNDFDLINELAIATQVAYNRMRPFKSKAYAESYAKRALTNTVNRIIYAYTHYESRKRLSSTEEGYENSHIELTRSISADRISYQAATMYDFFKPMYYGEDSMHDYLEKSSEKHNRKTG